MLVASIRNIEPGKIAGERYRRLHESIRRTLGWDGSGDLRKHLDDHRREAFESGGILRDASAFRLSYLRAEALKRYQQSSVSAASRRSAALTGFLASEDSCASTNVRLTDAFNKASTPEWVRTHLLRARNIASGILGTFPHERFARACAFSGGASTEFKRANSHPTKKWGLASHITVSAVPYYVSYHKWAGLSVWCDDYQVGYNDLDRSLAIVEHNEVFTVPKNFEKDRTIAKEPSWTMFFQKGLGSCIRDRLQREGLLAPTAQETHKGLAQVASRLGHLATIDLSAASDTVALALVELIMPESWLRHVLNLRVSYGLCEGKLIPYEKVSSMGNGFTFELETLLFYVICRAVCGTQATVSVYGDDIVIPVEHAEEVTNLLQYCGFKLNSNKSFSLGPFRESCGGHYFDGHDVTPFYVDQLPTTLPDVIDLHNRVAEWAERNGDSSPVRSLLRECRRLVPRKFWGPRCETGVLWAEWDEACPVYSKDCQSWSVSAFKQVIKQQSHDYFVGGLIASLVGSIEDPIGSYELRRDRRSSVLRKVALRSLEVSDSLQKSVFRYEQRLWRETKRLVHVGRRWAGPAVRLV